MSERRFSAFSVVALWLVACGGTTSGGNEPPGSGGSGQTNSGGGAGTSVPNGGGGSSSSTGGGAGAGGGSAGSGGSSAGAGGGVGGAAGGTGGSAGTGGTPGTGGTIDAGPVEMATGIEGAQAVVNYTCTPQTWDAAAVGWATQSGGITGGGTVAATTVTSLAAFNTAAGGTAQRVIMVSGRFSGTATIGSNKTILGMCGAEIDGHIQMGGSSNVIIRNLKVVGLNCTDNADCQSGADAITVEAQANHLWFDHMDVSNGSDGNLDITQASDFVTVSWSKFSYTGRAGGHQFSNLVGADDGDTGDTGHLRVTWHHNWWSTGVQDRMPRVRFGQVHVVNGLYTASGNDACVGVGVNANILLENNIFINVQDAIETAHANAASIVVSRGNIFQMVMGGFLGVGTNGFTPPYTYRVDTTNGLGELIMAKAGVK